MADIPVPVFIKQLKHIEILVELELIWEGERYAYKMENSASLLKELKAIEDVDDESKKSAMLAYYNTMESPKKKKKVSENSEPPKKKKKAIENVAEKLSEIKLLNNMTYDGIMSKIKYNKKKVSVSALDIEVLTSKLRENIKPLTQPNPKLDELEKEGEDFSSARNPDRLYKIEFDLFHRIVKLYGAELSDLLKIFFAVVISKGFTRLEKCFVDAVREFLEECFNYELPSEKIVVVFNYFKLLEKDKARWILINKIYQHHENIPAFHGEIPAFHGEIPATFLSTLFPESCSCGFQSS